MSNDRECAQYLKNDAAYRRCMEELRKKWKSYGRATGRITLKDATEKERRAIGGIVGESFAEGDVTFSFQRFEQGLQKTRFAPIDMKNVLEAYFQEPLHTNQERRAQERMEKEHFLEELEERFLETAAKEPAMAKEPMATAEPAMAKEPMATAEPAMAKPLVAAAELAMAMESVATVEPAMQKEPVAARWIRELRCHRSCGYQILMKEYARVPSAATDMAQNVGRALARLEEMEGEESFLAVFAAAVSGNPHYFDRGTAAGQLLTHAICFWKGLDIPQSAYEWRECMQSVQIVPDNIASFVHVFGVRIQTEGGWHPACEAFRLRNEPYVLTAENLRSITGAHADRNAVYIVENEMVFLYLVEHARDSGQALLCTSGQLRAAAIRLLDELARSGATLYYSGDLDPAGMDIADRLWLRYGDALRLWRMGPEDYRASISEERLDGRQLARLEHLKNATLRHTAGLAQREGRAGYQENLLPQLLGDVLGKL